MDKSELAINKPKKPAIDKSKLSITALVLVFFLSAFAIVAVSFTWDDKIIDRGLFNIAVIVWLVGFPLGISIYHFGFASVMKTVATIAVLLPILFGLVFIGIKSLSWAEDHLPEKMRNIFDRGEAGYQNFLDKHERRDFCLYALKAGDISRTNYDHCKDIWENY